MRVAALRIDGESVAPKRHRVVPDCRLLPGEHAVAEQHGGHPRPERRRQHPRARRRARAPRYGRAHPQRPRQARQIGVAIGDGLGAVVKEAGHRHQRHRVDRPRGRERGQASHEDHRQHGAAEGHGEVVVADQHREGVERAEIEGKRRLAHIERKAVEGQHHPEQRAHGGKRAHVTQRDQGEEGERGRDEAQGEERQLLGPHGPPRPAARSAQTAQRVEVQHEQHHREGGGDGLGEQRAHEERDRRPVEIHTSCATADRLHVGQGGTHVEQAREHVPPLRDPAHRFRAERVRGEEQGRRSGAESQGETAGDRSTEREPEQAQGEKVKEQRRARMQQHVGEVVAPRGHLPHRVVPAQREPGQRHVVAHVNGGEHPRELPRTEAAVVRVLEEHPGIVPVDPLGRERRREHADGDGDHQRSDEDAGHLPPIPRGRH